ncbi:MAG: hypothetical protein U0Q12_19880 [Vicinamibacterales bacterium]
MAGIMRRAGFRERFKDASATRAFLDDLEAKDGDRPQTLADGLAALRAAGFRDAGLVWMELRGGDGRRVRLVAPRRQRRGARNEARAAGSSVVTSSVVSRTSAGGTHRDIVGRAGVKARRRVPGRPGIA